MLQYCWFRSFYCNNTIRLLDKEVKDTLNKTDNNVYECELWYSRL